MPRDVTAISQFSAVEARTSGLQRIQILRFIAASAVVAFHAAEGFGVRHPATHAFPLAKYGYLGVDLFFVISGFIIHLVASSHEANWRLFLCRRVLRVVPLYWTCTIVMFALLTLLGRGVPPSVSSLVSSLFFVAWTTRPGGTPLIYLGWSLEYEAFFYLLVAAGLAISKKPWNAPCIIIASSALVGAVVGLNETDHVLSFLANPVLLEFTFGLLIGQTFAAGRVPWRTVVPIVIATFLAGSSDWGHRIVIGGLPAAVLVSGAVALDRREKMRGSVTRALVFLGDASYSIYLSQVLTIAALVRVGTTFSEHVIPQVIILSITLVAVAGGVMLYLMVEAPLRRLTRQYCQQRTHCHAIRVASD